MIKCNLAVLMAERNLKISELSKRTGISRTTLTALSQNQSKGIQFDTFDTLCNYLNIKPNDLFIQELFEYDFEVIQVTESNLNSTYNYLVTIKSEIQHNKSETISQFDCHVSYLFDENPFGDSFITGIQVFPKYDFDTIIAIDGIPITFKTSMEEELLDVIKTEFVIKYGLKEDCEAIIN